MDTSAIAVAPYDGIVTQVTSAFIDLNQLVRKMKRSIYPSETGFI